MPTVNQVKNEAREALAKARAILDSNGEKGAYDAAFADYTRLKTQAEQLATLEAEEKSLAARELVTESDIRDHKDAEFIPAASAKEMSDGVDGVVIKGADGRDEFMPFARPGLKAFNERPDLYAHLKDLQENTDSEGGYLVPTDQRTDIIVPPGTPGGVMRGISSTFTTTRDGGTWPRLSTDITMAVVAEEVAFAESDPAFGQVPFTIHKVGRAVDLSVELLADSAVNIPALLGARFTAARGRYEDQQGIEGDGSTEPLGLRTTGWATISDITDLLTLAAPTAVEIINAFYELPAQYRANASWFMTSSLFSRIVQIGAAAAGIHLIDTMGDAVAPRLLGRPVYFFDGTGWADAATISADEELGAIGDFRNYAFIDRAGMTVERDDSVAFRTDQVVFKARVRYDSLFLDNDAFRILKAAGS